MLSTARYIQTMKIDLCSKEVTMGHIPKRLISSAISISTYWYLNSWFCRRDSVSRSFIFGRYKMELTSNYKTYRKAICVCRYISLLLHVNVISIFIWALSFAIFLQSRKTRNWSPLKFSTNKEHLIGKEIERRDLILAPLNPLMLGSNLPLVYVSRTELTSSTKTIASIFGLLPRRYIFQCSCLPSLLHFLYSHDQRGPFTAPHTRPT